MSFTLLYWKYIIHFILLNWKYVHNVFTIIIPNFQSLVKISSWNGPTVHVCCFMLARASTKTFVSRVRKQREKSSLAEVSLYSVRLWFRMSKVCFQSPNTAIFDFKVCSSQLCVSVCLGHSAISNFHIFAIIRRKRINSVAIHRYFLVLILQLVGLCWNGAYLAATNSAFCVIVLRLTAGYRDLCSLWHKTLILLAPFTPTACFLDT